MTVEEKVSSRVIYSGKVVTLRVDEVRFASDGRPARREVVEHPGAVAVVPLTADGEVILVRQYRYAVGESLLELPAGTIERGEDPAQCAVRELREETGRRARRLEPLAVFFPSPGFCGEIIHLYVAHLADEDGADPAPEADERLEVVRMTLAAAVEMARGGGFRDGKTIAGVLLARARLEAIGGRPEVVF